MDDTLTEALGIKAQSLIQTTHWPNIDLIGAQLNLYWAEFQVPVWRMQGRGWKLWDALSDMLEADGVLDAYDLVFLDTPPALGYLTINGLAAADILLVPTGASFLEFDSTGRFFDMLHTTFKSIEDGENLAARALGRPEMAFSWDAVRTIVTRYDGSQQAELAGLMQAYLGRTLSAPPAGFHRPHRAGGRAGAGHLRGRLSQLQPRHLCPRARDLRRHLCRLQAASPRHMAAG
jgi:chromosome partitioning protein